MDLDPGSSTVIPRYLILIFLMLLGGGYFASAETSFASVNPIRIISEADNGNKRAKKALLILNNFDEALTAILIGNNIMHIGCSSVATLLAQKLWGNTSVTLITFITAFTVFIFAEMIPKSYAKDCNERLTLSLAPSLYFVMKMLTPLVFIFSGISNALSRLFGREEDEDVTLSEEEVFDIIENIDGDDEIEPDTTELVQSALEFTERVAKDILVPWNRVLSVHVNIDNDDLFKLIQETHFSRIPVLDADGDPIGILQIKRFLRAKLQGRKNISVSRYLDKLHFVPADMNIDDLLENMSKSRTHMALVYGNGLEPVNAAGRDAAAQLPVYEGKEILGIVTVEDILEELVGEIYDEEETEAKPE